MKKAVFISLLVFVAVILSSCASLITTNNFNLTGKWQFLFLFDGPVNVDITQSGTALVFNGFDVHTTSDSTSKISVSGNGYINTNLKQIVADLTINTFYVSSWDPTPTTETYVFHLTGDILSNNSIQGISTLMNYESNYYDYYSDAIGEDIIWWGQRIQE